MVLFVSLLLWACLSWTEGSEGVRECASQWLPASPVMHGARSVGLNPTLLPISSLTLSNDCLILWLSFLLCKMGLESVETLWDCCREPAGLICPQCSRLSPAQKDARTSAHTANVHLMFIWTQPRNPQYFKSTFKRGLLLPSVEIMFIKQNPNFKKN